jgi:Terminase large subunit, T4likevirus-type, N-terminal
MPRDPIGLSLVHALDAVAFAEDRLGFKPDPWQAKLLRSQSSQIILNCSRQSGKSTTTSILALHVALYEPASLVLLVSPSLRQSKELFSKVVVFLRSLEPAELLEEDNKASCTLQNKSRVISLPGDNPKTVRGYSGPNLIIEDEAAFVGDDLYTAIRPMLAVSHGRLVLMSTPAGKRGHFFETWHAGSGVWERIRLPAAECPRITNEFLEEERCNLGPFLFAQEYDCQFMDNTTSAFTTDLIEAAFRNDFPAFLAV